MINLVFYSVADSDVQCGSYGNITVCAKVTDLEETEHGYKGCIVLTKPGDKEVKLGCFQDNDLDVTVDDDKESDCESESDES